MKEAQKILYGIALVALVVFAIKWYDNYQQDKRLKVMAANSQLNWDRNELDTLIADSALLKEQMNGINSWQLLRTENEKASQIGQQTLKINKVKTAVVAVRQDIVEQQRVIKDNQ